MNKLNVIGCILALIVMIVVFIMPLAGEQKMQAITWICLAAVPVISWLMSSDEVE